MTKAKSDIIEHTLKVLEFQRIREIISGSCDSELGKRIASKLVPIDDPELIRIRLESIYEITISLRESGQPDLGGLYDVRREIDLATKEGVLSPEELWKVGLLADLSNRLLHYAHKGCEDKPRLRSILESLEKITGLFGNIGDYITAPGELLDNATPLLKELNKRRNIIHEKLQSKLENYLHNPTYEKILQEELVTLRNGRFVLPIKIERKSEMPGVIHDRSSSGATLFIEPLPVVEMNNELRELELAEKAERERILRLLTELVAASAVLLEANIETLAYLDFLVACARMSRRFDAVCPEYDLGGDFVLINARHPLLLLEEEAVEGFKVIPLIIELVSDAKALVITGPNMGGKTVALKTCGLLCSMASCGLPIPVDKGTKIPHFSAIFADIGDEQSIDDSLSSFAAHVMRWQQALDGADERSLVLIDEMGSATDPEEGTPLSRALLEELIARGSYLIVTTHLGGLKALAVATEGVENGAMTFDQENLRPTYSLRTGAPGRSWAFEIARRLGLSEKVLHRGEELVGAEGSHIDGLIADLQKKTQGAEELRAKAERELKTLQKDREILDALIESNRRKAHKVEELRKRYDDDKIEMLERELAIEKRKINEQLRSYRKAQDAAKAARETIKEKLEEIKETKKKRRGPARDFKKGDRVWLYRIQKHGTILRPTDSHGYILIEVDGLKVRMHSSAAMHPEDKQEKTPRKKRGVKYDRPEVPIAKDVRGMTFDEARNILDRWVSDALVVRMPQLNIIHGKGTGALREKIQKKLSRDKRISRWEIAEQHEGGEGATIVHLKIDKKK